MTDYYISVYDCMWYTFGIIGVGILLGAACEAAIVYYYYDGNIEKFNRTSLVGSSDDITIGLGPVSFGYSKSEDQFGNEIRAYSRGLSFGCAIPISIGIKSGNTKLWRPYRGKK